MDNGLKIGVPETFNNYIILLHNIITKNKIIKIP